MPRKVKKCKKYFFCLKQISKCDTCFYIHFSRAIPLKYSLVTDVDLVIKKLWAILVFYFTQTGLLPSEKKFTVIVSKMRVLGPKN